MTSPYLFFALLFVLGTGLVVVGTLLVRSERRVEPTVAVSVQPRPASADVFGALAALDEESAVVSEPQPVAPQANLTWTQTLVEPETELDAETRIDMLQRLALLAQPWCTPILQQARSEERDPAVRAVADDMLVMVLARPN